MINKVTFAGREECLTSSAKKIKAPVSEYISESTVLPQTTMHKVKNSAEIASEKLNEAYKAAHAPYIDAKPAAASKEFVMEGQQA